MALTLVTAPVGEPLTLAEVKSQVLQGGSIDDEYLRGLLIPAARERAETHTGRQMLTATWQLLLDRFPAGCRHIELPKPPVTSITSITYNDTNGASQTWASTNYTTQLPSGPRAARARVGLGFGKVWPDTRGEIGDVTIEFVSGYGDREDVPALLKMAMALDVGAMYANREDIVVGPGIVVVPLPHGAWTVYQSYRSHGTQRVAA